MRFPKHKFTAISVSAIALLLLASFPNRVSAQAPIEPERLPARTSFYFVWRGAPAAAVRRANSLLALWDDPEFAPVRAAFFENLVKDSAKDKSKPAPTREEIEQYATLVENPFLFGYSGEPEESARKSAPVKAGDAAQKWNGFFWVYDRTGKEALLAKAILQMRSQAKEPPQISAVTLAGVSALKLQLKNETTYWAETGKFAIAASEPRVFEEIVARLNAAPASGRTLADLAAYKEAQPFLAKGSLLEFFFRVPSLKEMAPAAKPGEFNFGPALDALHLDAVHSICGSVSLDGPRTRMRGALLGDAAEGTLFDVWSDGSATSRLAALVPADAISFNETTLNFVGMYRLLHNAVKGMSPTGQTGTLDIMETATQTRIGMPLADALALFTGEFATIQTGSDFDQRKSIFVLGIQKKPETLKLVRTLVGDRITSERNEGDVTYLKLSTHGGTSNAGTVQWGAYQVAVTPELIAGSGRMDVLRTALAQRGQGGKAPSLASQAAFQAARGRFPQALNGFAFADFQRVDWDAVKGRWLAEMTKSSTAAAARGNSRASISAAAPTWFEALNPQVFARHLHTASSGTWKDAAGLKFDGWIE